MADGKIIIETELDTDGIKKDLKETEKSAETSGKRIKQTFEQMAKASGKSVGELKNEVKKLAEEYQSQGTSLPNAYKKAYDTMGVYSERAAAKMKKAAESVEESNDREAEQTSQHWEKKFSEVEKDSDSAKDQLKQDAIEEARSHDAASEKSKEAWKNAFSTIGDLSKKALKATAAVVAGTSAVMVAAGTYSVKTGIEFESAFAGVKKTVDATDTQLNELRQSLINMSKEMPQSAAELSEIAEAAGQLGIKTENLKDFTKVMAQLGDATNMTSTEAADSLARFANITGMSQKNFDRLGSVIVALGNNLATTESEVVSMGMRLAGAGSQIGMSEAQIMSLAAALSSVGIEAEAGGSAFSTIMAKMQLAVESGGDSLDAFADVAGMSADKFKKAFQKDATSAIMAFIKGLSTCDEKGVSAIKTLDDMGISEIRQRDALLRASGAYDTFADAMKIGTTAWEENTALANEASQRYETLESKIDMAKNSADALAIAFKDSVDQELRDAVEHGTEYINELADAFENGGLEAAVDKAGDIIADLSLSLAKSAPDMVDAATDLIEAFVKGLLQNKPQLKHASKEIVDSVCDGLIKLLPKEMQQPAKKALDSLKKTFGSGLGSLSGVTKKELEIIGKLFTKLADHMDTVAPVVISLVAAFKTFQMVQGPVGRVVSVLMKLQSVSSETGLAVSALNAIMSANPAVLIAGAIAALVGGLALYATTVNQADAEQEAFNAKMDELGSNIESNQRSLDNLKESMENTGSSIEASVAPVEKWRDGLNDAFDSTGKVKEGCEDTANYILNQLNEAMGTSYSLTTDGFIQDNEGVKQSLEEVNQSIDAYIQSLKQKAVQEATTTQYTEAIQNQSEAQKNLTDAQKAYNDALNEYAQAQEDWKNGINDLSGLEKAQKNLDKTREKLGEASKASVEASVEVNGLDQVMGKLAEGTPESVQEALDMYAQIPAYASEAADGVATSQKEIQSALSSTDYTKMTEGFQLAVMQIDQSGGKIPVSLRSSVLQALNEVQKMGPEGKEYMESSMQQMMVAMEDKIPEFEEAASTTGEGILDTFQRYLVDSGALEGTGSEAIGQLSSGITSANVSIPAGQKALEATEAVSAGITQGSPAIQESAKNALESGINSGVTSADVTSAPTAAGKKAVDSEASGITSGMGAIGQALNTVNAYAMSQMSGSGLPQTAGQTGSDTAGKLASGLSGGQENTTRAALNLAKGVANSVKAVNLGSNLQNQAKQAVNLFAAGINGQVSKAASAGKNLGTSTANALKGSGLAASAREQGASFGNAFAVAIASQNSAARSTGNGLALNAKNALQAGINGSHNIGLQFSAGFAGGIRAGQNGVAAAAAAVANAAANAAKANLDIHSPSRVGDWIGKMFDYGISGGMTKNTSVVEKAAEHVTDSMRIHPAELLSEMKGAFFAVTNQVVRNRTYPTGSGSSSSEEKDGYNKKMADYMADKIAQALSKQKNVCEWNGREILRMYKEVVTG